MKISEINNQYTLIKGNFKSLGKFNFKGVYIICDEADEIVYIGSAYARDISIRLNQYIKVDDTGNSLGRTIAKTLANASTYDDIAKTKILDSVEQIKSFTIYAIKHEDLEYQLIKKTSPKYNNCGKEED